MDINEIVKHETDKVRKEFETKNLRDQFAMASLTGVLANYQDSIGYEGSIALRAYQIADAMLKKSK